MCSKNTLPTKLECKNFTGRHKQAERKCERTQSDHIGDMGVDK
jgi:hypothetical protein